MNSCWMHWVQARIALRQLQAFTGQNMASALCLPSKIAANCQPQALSNAVWGFSNLEIVHERLLEAAAAIALKKLQASTGQNIANIVRLLLEDYSAVNAQCIQLRTKCCMVRFLDSSVLTPNAVYMFMFCIIRHVLPCTLACAFLAGLQLAPMQASYKRLACSLARSLACLLAC